MSKLRATSKVIELNKDKKYLFIFSRKSGLRMPQLSELMKALSDEGFNGIAVMIKDVKELSIVEQNI